jgi:hypothetical protein
MPTGKIKTLTPSRIITTSTNPGMEMRNHLHGFHHQITNLNQIE